MQVLDPRSERWLITSVKLTRPVDWRALILCDDDCEHCPLYLKGCAGECDRWNDAVCADCPCLASRAATMHGEPRTVLPRSVDRRLIEATPAEELLVRRTLNIERYREDFST